MPGPTPPTADSGPLPELPSALPEHLLLFDGVCNLCNGLVRFVIRHDRRERFRFAPLQSGLGKALLQRHGLAHGGPDSLVYLRKGRLHHRSAAALHAARDLGGVWALAYGLMLLPRPLRDAAYDLVARHRYRWFGRRDACMVPTPDLRSRFLA